MPGFPASDCSGEESYGYCFQGGCSSGYGTGCERQRGHGPAADTRAGTAGGAREAALRLRRVDGSEGAAGRAGETAERLAGSGALPGSQRKSSGSCERRAACSVHGRLDHGPVGATAIRRIFSRETVHRAGN